jgi:hypothetical protein
MLKYALSAASLGHLPVLRQGLTQWPESTEERQEQVRRQVFIDQACPQQGILMIVYNIKQTSLGANHVLQTVSIAKIDVYNRGFSTTIFYSARDRGLQIEVRRLGVHILMLIFMLIYLHLTRNE